MGQGFSPTLPALSSEYFRTLLSLLWSMAVAGELNRNPDECGSVPVSLLFLARDGFELEEGVVVL